MNPDYSSLSQYIKTIPKRKKLQKEEELQLVKKAQNQSKEALEEIIKNNLSLVVRIAKNYANMGLPLEDLIAEGNIGLIKSIQKFNTNSGYRLSTYSTFWIKESIRNAILKQTRTIHIPRKTLLKIFKIKKIYQELSYELGRQPTPEEFEENTGIEKKTLLQTLQWSEQTVSIHNKNQNGEELGNTIPEENQPPPSKTILWEKEWIEKLIQTLKPKEKEVIEARFGLNQDPKTLKEIGEKLGISKERIRQIETSALQKMRKKLKQKGISNIT